MHATRIGHERLLRIRGVEVRAETLVLLTKPQFVLKFTLARGPAAFLRVAGLFEPAKDQKRSLLRCTSPIG